MNCAVNRSCWILLCLTLLSCTGAIHKHNFGPSSEDMHFNHLPTVWDEGIPLGNGMVGALVWENKGKLRFSLDRADLWDLRPMENLKTPEWKYTWVHDQWQKKDYKPVQDKFDVPYDRSPAPSKIPGAAIEVDISGLGEIEAVHLSLEKAICEVTWKNGLRLITFVHATDPVGWFRFEGLEDSLSYLLIPPAYDLKGESGADSPVTGQDLRRLEYPSGNLEKGPHSMTYEQEGWGGFKYQVHVEIQEKNKFIEGCWSISSEFPRWDRKLPAREIVTNKLKSGFEEALTTHTQWWKGFWSKSSISVPDEVLQKQWMLEQYKFGSAARAGAPPISLQSVWTADNGKLPPWKGDFHHDLNTQLSYWPAYSANHLEEEQGFLDWLWKYRETFKRYTQAYYETKGLNVPGVTTLTGEPMGGWIQYSLGPTVSSWLAHHFYLHWRYTMDRQFLAQKAYAWIKEVAIYLEDISEMDAGVRKLPISSSPEFNNNSREAWFEETTNFDLALIRWTYEKAAELALELGENEEAKNWENILSEWPNFAVNEESGLMLTPSFPYEDSHRHFSHQLAYHPLGLIDFSKGATHQAIIRNTIATLETIGSGEWVGYSFSWMGNLKARAFDGTGAAEILRIFATSFCLPNSFHVNGDQSGKGYSNFIYRPFTLEGNFAFAAGLQEMLIQSHTGIIHVFPAVPDTWKDIRFVHLRTEGAFLVSAIKNNGLLEEVQVESTMGGKLKLKNPFENNEFECSQEYEIVEEDVLSINTAPGDHISVIMINK